MQHRSGTQQRYPEVPYTLGAYPKGAYVLPYAARSAVYVVTHCVLLGTSHGLNCFGYSTILRVPPYIGRVVSMAQVIAGLCG